MGVEIERKFLVKSDAWRATVVRSTRLSQGYVCSQSGRTVRVRVAGERAFLTIKGPADARGVSRSEWEYEIPVAQAREMLDTVCEGPRVEKVRHEVMATGAGGQDVRPTSAGGAGVQGACPTRAGGAGGTGGHDVRPTSADGGLVWEVDEFLGENAPLVLAEIELPAADAVFERPSWLGVEVSADARYRNSYLAAKPYGTWGRVDELTG